ncbi:MAG: EAL domain-containing protein [Gammaproteobacteria bacterium]|nr:EAL domain-containing protein [Gammaproteobacteria bacterium]
MNRIKDNNMRWMMRLPKIIAMRRLLRQLPLAVQTVMLGLLFSGLIWLMLDFRHTRQLRDIFGAEFAKTLEEQSSRDRFYFNRAISAHADLLKLLVKQKEVQDHLLHEHASSEGWDTADIEVKRVSQEHMPRWISRRSITRFFLRPNFLLILDAKNRVREVYQNRDAVLPKALLTPSPRIIALSKRQTFLTNINGSSFLIATAPIRMGKQNIAAQLMSVSRLDEHFLVSCQALYTDSLSITATLTGEPLRVAASSDPGLIPAGSLVKDLKREYRVMGLSFFDYGASELSTHFVSFVPHEAIREWTAPVLSLERRQRTLQAVVLISFFLVLLLFVSARIRRLIARVAKFTRDAFGVLPSGMRKGDELNQLNKQFVRLSREVLSSRQALKKEATEKLLLVSEQMALKADSERMQMLQSVTETLGIGVIRITETGAMAENSQMKRFARECGGIGAFLRSSPEDGDLTLRDSRDHLSVFELTQPEGIDPDLLLVQNVTARRRAEQALRDSEERFRAIAQSANAAIITIDGDSKVVSWNRAAERIFGYTAAEVMEKSLTVIMPRRYRDAHNAGVSRLCADGEAHLIDTSVELPGLHKNGTEIPMEISFATWTVGNKRYFTGIIRDITDRKQAEEKLSHLAHHDPLTDLPNRMLFNIRLGHALKRAQFYGTRVAVLYLDLDRFKQVNDSFGHPQGDRLLKTITSRVLTTVRKADSVARLGGDEFSISIENIRYSQDAAMVARKLLKLFAEPYVIQDREFRITCSIGISLFPEDGRDIETLVKHADAAMYQAKEQGRNNYQFYLPDINAKPLELLLLESGLHKALEQHELVVYYQPQFDSNSRRLTGMEALVRWQHPEKGLILPGDIIPLAEETDLIVPIGEWVLRTACIQNKTWQDQGYAPMRVAVNLSPCQFKRQNLVEVVTRVLRETGLEPRYLELEITESILMSQVEETIVTLKELNRIGIEFSIDDFGTGYCSLNYLKRFPIHKLKIDQSFVRDIAKNANDAAIVSSIIALGQGMNLRLIAEGVETEAQLDFLHEQGCHESQGFLFSHPVAAKEFEQFFQS